MQKLVAAFMVVMFMGITLVVTADDDKKKPKYSIKDVMKKAMKGKGALCSKVANGKGDKKDAETLLGMFEALGKQKPPKGDAKDWKKKCDALVKAAKDAVAGKASAGADLKAAAKCGTCHKAHKK